MEKWGVNNNSSSLPRPLQGFLIWVLHCMKRETLVKDSLMSLSKMWGLTEMRSKEKIGKARVVTVCTDGIRCQWCGPGSWSSWTAGWQRDEPTQTCPGLPLAWSLPGTRGMHSRPQGPWQAVRCCMGRGLSEDRLQTQRLNHSCLYVMCLKLKS